MQTHGHQTSPKMRNASIDNSYIIEIDETWHDKGHELRDEQRERAVPHQNLFKPLLKIVYAV